MARLANTDVAEADKSYARKMYDKYHDDAINAFAQGEKSEKTLTEHHLKDIEAALRRAHKYLEKDEIKAADELLSLTKKHALGKNVRQVLALLNDKDLAQKVADIIDKVKFIKPNRDCCH